MRNFTKTSLLLCVAACSADSGDTSSSLSSSNGGSAGGVRGAIFTTLVDGSAVDANIYDAKPDVYLDGGPGNNAPSNAAALAEGDYYFKVTDPSGKTLLSTDALECRRFHVNAAGVIDAVVGGCAHATGTDQDHGGLTVQLMPYDDTPNHGGEYKAWVAPVSDNGNFANKSSKTDNFKVRTETTPPPPPPGPCCGDGHVDSGEQCDDGNTTNGDGCSSTCQIETPPPPAPCCGDGHLDAGEQCDDGNTVSGDGCSSTCMCETSTPATRTDAAIGYHATSSLVGR